jgi:hypothetical protein
VDNQRSKRHKKIAAHNIATQNVLHLSRTNFGVDFI